MGLSLMREPMAMGLVKSIGVPFTGSNSPVGINVVSTGVKRSALIMRISSRISHAAGGCAEEGAVFLVLGDIVKTQNDVAHFSVFVGDMELSQSCTVIGDFCDQPVFIGQGVELNRNPILGLAPISALNLGHLLVI